MCAIWYPHFIPIALCWRKTKSTSAANGKPGKPIFPASWNMLCAKSYQIHHSCCIFHAIIYQRYGVISYKEKDYLHLKWMALKLLCANRCAKSTNHQNSTGALPNPRQDVANPFPKISLEHSQDNTKTSPAVNLDIHSAHKHHKLMHACNLFLFIPIVIYFICIDIV